MRPIHSPDAPAKLASPYRAPTRTLRALESAMLFVLLLIFWTALSGRLTTLALVLGVAAAAGITTLTPERVLWWGHGERAFGIAARRIAPLRIVRYGAELLMEIVLANFQVARLVLHPRLPIDPAFVQFRVPFPHLFPRVALAHVITLTPGTVTVDLEDGQYFVHALSPALTEDLASGRIGNAVAGMFREPPVSPPALDWARTIPVRDP